MLRDKFELEAQRAVEHTEGPQSFFPSIRLSVKSHTSFCQLVTRLSSSAAGQCPLP